MNMLHYNKCCLEMENLIGVLFCLVLTAKSVTSDISCDVPNLRSLLMHFRQFENEYKQSFVLLRKKKSDFTAELAMFKTVYGRDIKEFRNHLSQSKAQLADQNNLTGSLQSQLNETEATTAKQIEEVRNQVNSIKQQRAVRQSLNAKQYIEINNTIAVNEDLIQALPEFNISLQNMEANLEFLRGKSEIYLENTTADGFSVYSSVNETGQYTAALRFHSEHYNSGGVYNTSSGEFVCRKAGLYVFFSVVYSNNRSYCYFTKNSNTYNPLGYAFSTTHYSLGTGVILFDLQVGDRVYLSRCFGYPFIYFYYSSFTGFLIHGGG